MKCIKKIKARIFNFRVIVVLSEDLTICYINLFINSINNRLVVINKSNNSAVNFYRC